MNILWMTAMTARCWRTVIANLLLQNALTGWYKNKFTRPTKPSKNNWKSVEMFQVDKLASKWRVGVFEKCQQKAVNEINNS